MDAAHLTSVLLRGHVFQPPTLTPVARNRGAEQIENLLHDEKTSEWKSSRSERRNALEF